ncbi:MAG: amidohydrolase family protein [Burkholderiales bacterium]|nr:amidohydrolase family protein [Burkholderiales bacterium]
MKLRSGAICFVTFAALAVFLVGSLMPSDSRAQSRNEWIDVHFHLVADKGDLESFDEAARMALQVMDAERIRTIIVMSPPRPRENFDIESLAAVAKKYAPRIVMLGGGGTLNPMLQEAGKSPAVTEEVRRRFEETTRGIIASGARGFGEITAHHVSLSPSHGYESVPADHPLLLLLADIAAQHDVPIDLHFDPVSADVEKPANLTSPRNPEVLKENIGGFERLLAHNRKTKIIWAHAGSDPVGHFTPKLVRELLGRHANLSLSIRPSGPFRGAMVPPKGAINDDWIAVLRDFPDRFVLGTDNFIVPTRYTGPDAPRIFAQRAEIQRIGVRRLLSHLPQDVARSIGYENAERLYRLDR